MRSLTEDHWERDEAMRVYVAPLEPGQLAAALHGA